MCKWQVLKAAALASVKTVNVENGQHLRAAETTGKQNPKA